MPPEVLFDEAAKVLMQKASFILFLLPRTRIYVLT